MITPLTVKEGPSLELTFLVGLRRKKGNLGLRPYFLSRWVLSVSSAPSSPMTSIFKPGQKDFARCQLIFLYKYSVSLACFPLLKRTAIEQPHCNSNTNTMEEEGLLIDHYNYLYMKSASVSAIRFFLTLISTWDNTSSASRS